MILNYACSIFNTMYTFSHLLTIPYLADARHDSPGHNAKDMTYTVMNASDNKIISLVTVEKRETGLRSNSLEHAGFERSMNSLLNERKLDVKEIVTDAHTQISASMSTLPSVFCVY